MAWRATFGLVSGYPHAPSCVPMERFILMPYWS